MALNPLPVCLPRVDTSSPRIHSRVPLKFNVSAHVQVCSYQCIVSNETKKLEDFTLCVLQVSILTSDNSFTFTVRCHRLGDGERRRTCRRRITAWV